MDAVWTGLDNGRDRPNQESSLWRTLCLAVSDSVSDNGMAGGDSRASALAPHSIVRSGVDTRRRHRLFFRRRLLCRTSRSLRALRLAPIRPRRHRLPLLRGALVFSLVFPSNYLKRGRSPSASPVVSLK